MEKRLSARVRQDNDLVRAAYKMTLQEKRLLILAISKINKRPHPPSKGEQLNCSITAKEWAEHYPSEKAYGDLKAAAKALIRRTVRVHPTTKVEREMSWVDHTDYHHNEGRCDIWFGSAISTYLAGWLDQYTEYDLLNVGKMSSIYSVRLYELLMQMEKEGKGWLKISIDELRTVLDIGESYKRMPDFKRWVLNNALSEINTKSDLEVSFELIKEGRATVGLHFSFNKKEQRDLFSLGG